MTTSRLPSPAGPWIERLARAGYMAKGVVYLLIGLLALLAAAGAGGKTTVIGGLAAYGAYQLALARYRVIAAG